MRKTKADLELENKALYSRLRALIDCDPTKFNEFHYKDGKLQVAMEGNGAVAALVVQAFKGILDEAPAPNYVEMLWNVGDSDQVIFTIQRPEGKTPNTLRREAEDKLLKLKLVTDRLVRYLSQAHVRQAADTVFGEGVATELIEDAERLLK